MGDSLLVFIVILFFLNFGVDLGIFCGSVCFLFEEYKWQLFGGIVLQFGCLMVYFMYEELCGWVGMYGVVFQDVEMCFFYDLWLVVEKCIDDCIFFEVFGFDCVILFDIEEWEGVDYIFDFNELVFEDFEGKFDVVFEMGILVQIFYLFNVLMNVYKLFKLGGCVVYVVVFLNNYMDFGFYMLCLMFFFDYYVVNGWQIDSYYFCEYYVYWYCGCFYLDIWDIYQYELGCFDGFSYGCYGGKQVVIFFVVMKMDEMMSGVNLFFGQY